MEIIRLREKDLINPKTEAHYAFISGIKSTVGIHYHDFFELFILVEGNAIHNVNGISQRLGNGSFVFIRPDDVHFYESLENTDFQFINLAFPKSTVEALFSYLGPGFMSHSLLSCKLPPCIILTETEKHMVKSRLENLNTLPYSNEDVVRTELRVLLLEFLTRYFSYPQKEDTDLMPKWLKDTLVEMQKIHNFVQGLNAMQVISGKSMEHLCRIFRKHLDKTPSQYVNELRLNYAANLLTHSDSSVIEIAMQSGFDNLSHFYHLFKKKFDVSPAVFRGA